VALYASLSTVRCPACGASVVARGINHGRAEPKLNTATCSKCGTELQVSKDPATGKTRAERVKKN